MSRSMNDPFKEGEPKDRDKRLADLPEDRMIDECGVVFIADLDFYGSHG